MPRGKLNQLTWRRPALENLLALREPLSDVALLLREVGVPTANKATAREEAVELLHAAAEVEHSLLVQYLYAAYSLPLPDDTTRSRLIAQIAHQEMGHLMTVQNLLLAVGGPIYFDRQDRSPNPGDDPIPFRLEPLSLDALSKYIAAEMPALGKIPDPEERAQVENIRRHAEEICGVGVHRVGALYVKIYWLFQSTDQPEGPLQLPNDGSLQSGFHLDARDFADPTITANFQAQPNDWGVSPTVNPGFYIDPVSSRAEALAALHRIMVQGEGWEAGEDTHYRRFLRLYRTFSGSASPVPVPVNPTAGEPLLDPIQEENRISNPLSQNFAYLFNVRYRFLLALLIHAMIRPRNDASALRQDYLLPWGRTEMRRFLRGLAELLVRLPRRNPSDVLHAAPTFELGTTTLPETEAEVLVTYRALLNETARIIDQIRQYAQTPGTSLLAEIEQDDAARREIIQQLL